jgi:hypothetical protein
MSFVHVRSTASSILVTGALAIQACIPPYADYQSAKLVGPGRAEITPFYSSMWFSADGETEKVQDDIGVQLATGLVDNVDVRIRYERISVNDNTLHVVAAGPKFLLVRNRLALFTPIGTAFGEDIESSELWQLQPTLLFTAQAAPAIEVNASAKTLLWLDSDGETLLAFNLGLGLNPRGTDIWFRPETGLLVNPGESGYAFHFGIGLTLFAGGR